jgi:hypothetical protein
MPPGIGTNPFNYFAVPAKAKPAGECKLSGWFGEFSIFCEQPTYEQPDMWIANGTHSRQITMRAGAPPRGVIRLTMMDFVPIRPPG